MATAALINYRNRFAESERLTRLAANRRLMDAVFLTAVLIVGVIVAACAASHGVELLKQANVIPQTGAISGVSNLVTTIMNSVKWYAFTLVGLALVVIAAMFVSGHQSAHSHGMRIGFGVIALVAVPGIIS